MNLRSIVVTCALFGAACGGQDSRPAQDPASTSTPAFQTSTTATEVPNDRTANGAAATTRGTANTTTVTPAGSPDPTARSANTMPGQEPVPTVASDPGVADATKDADNTRINDRDRHGALTPMDQGNSGAETKITATIRRGIMGNSTLSFTAKNVKVITVGSKVTLRGPVKSDQERATIAALAAQTAGVSNVDNQLEVKK